MRYKAYTKDYLSYTEHPIDWCNTEFGLDNYQETWCYLGRGRFEFDNENDFVEFTLRWC